MQKKKVLVIVAHPDDEVLWMGGNLIRNKTQWDTTLICLTRASDRDRAPKFKKVMKELEVKGHIYDLDDENLGRHLKEKEILNILKKFSKTNYDMLFTHNLNGEYGHIRHIDTHQAVKYALKKEILKSKKTLFFSYHKVENSNQGYAKYNSSADILIKLHSHELRMKRKLAIETYGYDRGGTGFEENSAGPIEGFDEYKDDRK